MNCACGHRLGQHQRSGGSCLVRSCDCQVYRPTDEEDEPVGVAIQPDPAVETKPSDELDWSPPDDPPPADPTPGFGGGESGGGGAGGDF
jgi:hypothetical protein